MYLNYLGKFSFWVFMVCVALFVVSSLMMVWIIDGDRSVEKFWWTVIVFLFASGLTLIAVKVVGVRTESVDKNRE